MNLLPNLRLRLLHEALDEIRDDCRTCPLGTIVQWHGDVGLECNGTHLNCPFVNRVLQDALDEGAKR